MKPVGSKPLKNYGSTLVSLELEKGMKTELIPFVIIDQKLQYDVILGLPAMQQLGIKLDLEKGTATIKNNFYKLNVNEFTNHAEIRSKSNQTLKPGTEHFIEVEVDESILQNEKEIYHMIIPSRTLTQIQVIQTPYGVTKEKLTHMLIGNRLDKPVLIKKGAILGHIIANNPKDNLNFLTEEIEDEIEEKIYLPTNSKSEYVTKDELIKHLNYQTNHLDNNQKKELTENITKFLDLFASNPNKPGIQTKTKMHVPLKEGTIPIKLNPYRSNPTIPQEIFKQVNQLL